MSRPYKSNLKAILLRGVKKHSISTQSQKRLIDLADGDLNQLLMLKQLHFALKTRSRVALLAKNKEKNLHSLHIIGKILYNKRS